MFKNLGHRLYCQPLDKCFIMDRLTLACRVYMGRVGEKGHAYVHVWGAVHALACGVYVCACVDLCFVL